MPSGSNSSSLVWQSVEATAYQAYKICHVVDLKKKKSQCYRMRFLRKARLKIYNITLQNE